MNRRTSHRNNCLRCGLDIEKHRLLGCPAYNKKCFRCNIPGHFKRKCRTNLKKKKNTAARKRRHSSTKSENQKKRDAERMEKFIERKRSEFIFPFASVDNEDFSKLMQKHCGFVNMLNCAEEQIAFLDALGDDESAKHKKSNGNAHFKSSNAVHDSIAALQDIRKRYWKIYGACKQIKIVEDNLNNLVKQNFYLENFKYEPRRAKCSNPELSAKLHLYEAAHKETMFKLKLCNAQ